MHVHIARYIFHSHIVGFSYSYSDWIHLHPRVFRRYQASSFLFIWFNQIFISHWLLFWLRFCSGEGDTRRFYMLRWDMDPYIYFTCEDFSDTGVSWSTRRRAARPGPIDCRAAASQLLVNMPRSFIVYTLKFNIMATVIIKREDWRGRFRLTARSRNQKQVEVEMALRN